MSTCLLSTAKLNEAGQTVVLTKEHSYIEDVKIGDRIPLDYHNRVYTLNVWVRAAPQGGLQTMCGAKKVRFEEDQEKTQIHRNGPEGEVQTNNKSSAPVFTRLGHR